MFFCVAGTTIPPPTRYSDCALGAASTSSMEEVQEGTPKPEEKKSKKRPKRKAAEGAPPSKKSCQSKSSTSPQKQLSDQELSEPSTSSKKEDLEEVPKPENMEAEKSPKLEGAPASKKSRQSEAAGEVNKPVPINEKSKTANKFNTGEKSGYKNYTPAQLDNAVKEVLDGTLNASSAAKKYQVPTRTVYDKLKKLREGRNARLKAARGNEEI